MADPFLSHRPPNPSGSRILLDTEFASLGVRSSVIRAFCVQLCKKEREKGRKNYKRETIRAIQTEGGEGGRDEEGSV